jgi:hypothetical protein
MRLKSTAQHACNSKLTPHTVFAHVSFVILGLPIDENIDRGSSDDLRVVLCKLSDRYDNTQSTSCVGPSL